jgi:hypothetical protein
VNGIATFSGLTIDLAGTGYVLTFTVVGIGSTFASASFTVSAVADFVPVAHASDLEPQLRVSPDRVADTNLENLVSFSFKVKNIGAGYCLFCRSASTNCMMVAVSDAVNTGVACTMSCAISCRIYPEMLPFNRK